MCKLKKSILIAMSLIFLAGCIQKADTTDTIPETTAIQNVVKTVETNESTENISNHTTIYILKTDREELILQIILDENNKSFSFSYDVLSSYLAVGTYMMENEQLKLETDDGKYHYTFDIIDDNTLKFNQENSSDIGLINETLKEEMKDGAEFIADTPNPSPV